MRTNLRRQDSFTCFARSAGDVETLLAVVSDGAGSASKGGEGASITCRTFATASRAHLLEHKELPSDVVIESWIQRTRSRIEDAAVKRGLQPRDFAATLIFLMCIGTQTLVVHIGDGAAVVQPAGESDWFAASWPSHGEYSSTTFFVTDNPDPRVSIARLEHPISAIAVFSDGIENLALDFKRQQPHRQFFDAMFKPLVSSQARGKDTELSRRLESFLDSAAVNERTDDDKTLILALRR